jgi:hypothetical protein
MTLDNQPTSDQGLPAVPGLKKVTADASGFIALALEGFGRDIAGPAGGNKPQRWRSRARVDRRAVRSHG